MGRSGILADSGAFSIYFGIRLEAKGGPGLFFVVFVYLSNEYHWIELFLFSFDFKYDRLDF
jgi:hypothetical protein